MKGLAAVFIIPQLGYDCNDNKQVRIRCRITVVVLSEKDPRVAPRSEARDLFAYELKTKEVELAAAIQKDDEGERNRRHALNTAWNAETRTQATTPLRSLLEQLTVEHDRRLLDFRQTMSDRVERERARIQAILAAEPNIITRDNIDAKLEEIFNSDVVDYNFMVDHNGRIVRGSQPYENPNQEAPSNDTEPRTDPSDPLSVQV
ncbi:hypothetical protein CLF_103734 [Clonorchis sinensis]|uniref:Uncharacterized protein n=1 Tax=Clonorchis sinensis TaxID=79923 RepID=H2KQE0_CLOSI|nr:hypothetical protein CLF_103734 [Clonorchis sinensis]